jgi:hypothetical protein
MQSWQDGRKKGLPTMEIKKNIKLLGFNLTVTDVPIKAATESFAEYELEDGSKIKVKFVASSFLRVDGEYAPDGKPVYLVFSAPAVNVLTAKPELMRAPEPAQN